MYSTEAIAQLAKYDMVTIEKCAPSSPLSPLPTPCPITLPPLPLRRWYTLCGAKHPQQGTPDCDVESKFYETFRAIEAINPKVTNIICAEPSAPSRHFQAS